MKNILKQFVAWVTLSNQSKFKKAVIRLTFYYTAGVFIVLIIFNFMVYGLFSNNIKIWNYENKEHPSILNKEKEIGENKIQEIQLNLLNNLLTSDAIILIITLLMAYLLSKKTLAPLEDAYRKQTNFVANAAHELRTPLAVMKAGSEVVLRKDRTINEYTKYINESMEEIKRLTNLSNDLLFLARNDKKKELIFSEISFSEICKNQLNIIKHYADLKNISIKNEVSENLMIKGDKYDLTRLVINLLKNAIDYNKPNGTITLSLKKINHEIILSIIDTGIGIKTENISQIFERFYKVDNSRKQDSTGAGLGLSIVKGIIDEHHGNIKVESLLDIGTTFTVIFPYL